MQIGLDSKQNFTSAVFVKLYKRNANGIAEVVTDFDTLKAGRKSVVKMLSGPAKTKDHENMIRELAVRDPDYDYNMGKTGVFTRPINGIFRSRPAREFLRFISDEFPGLSIMFTGPQAIKLSVIGEKIGKIKKKCMNLTAIGLGIPAENTLVKGKSLYKWSKSEKELINKNLINTDELLEEKHHYADAIKSSLFNKNIYLTNCFNSRTKTREGDIVVMNYLLNDLNKIEKCAVTPYK